MKKNLLFPFLLCLVLIAFPGRSQDNITWGEIDKAGGYAVDILPVDGASFYKISRQGGAFGSYFISYYENFKIRSSNKIQPKIGSSMASIEDYIVVNQTPYVVLSNKSDGKHILYFQKYGTDCKPAGEPVELISYDFIKGPKSKGNFTLLQSQNGDFFSVEYSLPGNKMNNQRFGYKILDKAFDVFSEGEFEVPYESYAADLSNHYLSNTGDYFFSCKVYAMDDKNKIKNYNTLNKVVLMHVTPEALEEFELELDSRKIFDMSFSSDNDQLMTFTGLYGDNKKNSGIKGVFYFRLDYDKKEILDEGFEEFKKDFITEGWSDKAKEKASKKEAKGKGAPEFFNYDIRRTHTLKDGSIIGSLEQYYIQVVSYNDPRTGMSSYTYYYHYNDLIVYKIQENGTFEWIKKIPKRQVSANDGGIMSSVATYIDETSVNFIFNDNILNYDNNGEFVFDYNNKEGKLYSASYSKKSNCVVNARVDFQDGTVERKTIFDAKSVEAFAFPKFFETDYVHNTILMYFKFKKNERFGLMDF